MPVEYHGTVICCLAALQILPEMIILHIEHIIGADYVSGGEWRPVGPKQAVTQRNDRVVALLLHALGQNIVIMLLVEG